jgi:hypothetical protein
VADQGEKLQHQFLECMDSLGRELSQLAGALNLPPCEVATEKVKASVLKSQIGVRALSRARSVTCDVGNSHLSPRSNKRLMTENTTCSLASQGSGHTPDSTASEGSSCSDALPRTISMASQGSRFIQNLSRHHARRRESIPAQPIDERFRGQ